MPEPKFRVAIWCVVWAECNVTLILSIAHSAAADLAALLSRISYADIVIPPHPSPSIYTNCNRKSGRSGLVSASGRVPARCSSRWASQANCRVSWALLGQERNRKVRFATRIEIKFRRFLLAGFTWRKSDTGEERGYEFYKIPMPSQLGFRHTCSPCPDESRVSGDPLLLHRSTLITALLDGLPPPPICTIHTSSRITGYSYSKPGNSDGPVTLHLADGSTREADVVVGADGIRSAIRNSMFPGGIYVDMVGEKHTVGPKWTGVVGYRALITRSQLERVSGGGHRALTIPLLVSILALHGRWQLNRNDTVLCKIKGKASR
jgi:hypothetical protein